ncbi:thiE: thiamine-phosphate pyrophosphorylase [Rubrobacter radiotolerans]|uniref:Thiamine-phosphate synthase n=1 Tax=Rubrobacter radiotolerans TaxID=42256 RepID=A0A023X5G6_RUBRA|nr:thiamine phosphate synthase [Rubrobacter radiotolerans]AHY47712.1 thiE: thiamine-phosphate pyrophosphorylase [Rubrobacter radiotolerans]MDX5895115.1 thiamine phosphate synthase [Rubrobacter radiotolerans]SMC07483.1 thiamine-phosphate pyrophosphorylase [Rubrobacter radiotolerans DSM 5868]
MRHSPNHDLLRRSRLLLVTDPRPDLTERVAAAVRGGVGVVQLRDKTTPRERLLPLADRLREVCEAGGALFTVNDDADLALRSGAGGVHLGQEDGPLAEARELLGESAVIGRSVGTLEEAREAVREGADYLGAGTIYATPTKSDTGPISGPRFLTELARADLGLPFYAIGGITAETAAEAARAGAWGFAVVRAVLDAPDPESAARDLLRYLERGSG